MSATALLSFLAAGAARSSDAKQGSLSALLERNGIPVIPLERVYAHRRLMIANARPRSLGIVLAAVSIVLRGMLRLSLTSSFSQRQTIHWALTIVCGVFASLVLMSYGFGAIGLIPALPFAAFISLGVLSGLFDHHTEAMLFARWESQPLRDYDTYVPNAVRAIAKQAEAFRGLHARVEYFQDDPFLAITRGWGPFRETARVGAWDTGDDWLDNFTATSRRNRI